MAIAQLEGQSALELLQLFADLCVLIMCLFECSFVELLFFADKENLILFSRQNLCQCNDPVLCMAESDRLLGFVPRELTRHVQEVLQSHLAPLLLLLDLSLLEEELLTAHKRRIKTALHALAH